MSYFILPPLALPPTLPSPQMGHAIRLPAIDTLFAIADGGRVAYGTASKSQMGCSCMPAPSGLYRTTVTAVRSDFPGRLKIPVWYNDAARPQAVASRPESHIFASNAVAHPLHPRGPPLNPRDGTGRSSATALFLNERGAQDDRECEEDAGRALWPIRDPAVFYELGPWDPVARPMGSEEDTTEVMEDIRDEQGRVYDALRDAILAETERVGPGANFVRPEGRRRYMDEFPHGSEITSKALGLVANLVPKDEDWNMALRG
ncbi:hypothetical protein BC834DRAFT_846723 [Gloeopeniophorella convolvens]|nr:hypothetical protein BC834DRAFT_846723 [Gloeopeniophorella convolvens]